MMGRFICRILALEAVFMLPAMGIAAFFREWNTVIAFAGGMGITLIVAGLLYLLSRGYKQKFYAKEGLVCVGISWIFMSLLGCIPFCLSGAIPNYVDALFEMVSGFTTTGASILPEVESLPKGVLYWRSFSHWLGGMGVLVFLLAIASGNEGKSGYTMHLLRAESPGPNVGKLVPHMKKTASILYWMYILLTVLNFMFLMFGGMPLFDSVCTALGTAGTGGFGIKNDSMGSYSPYLQNVTTIFMLLFGVNFGCYYLLIIKQVKNVLKDEELRFYVFVVLASIGLISLDIRGLYTTLEETIRHAAFQVATIISTTGFSTADFDTWGSFSKSILIFLMIIGGCAGSTGGGFKCGRALLIFKSMRRSIQQIVHPQKVQVVRLNKQTVDEKVIQNTNAYLSAYVLIVIISFLLVSLDNFSVTTHFTSVLACFNNIGPGLDLVGPAGNYGAYSAFSKIVLIIDMLAGRLEIFPILILFTGETWRHR